MRARSTIARSAWIVIAGGCASAGEPLSEVQLRELLPPAPAAVRLQLEVEIEGDRLRGTFQGLLVARPSPPAVRLQLLPELGTPILDVAATADAVTGVWYGDAATTTWRGRADDPPLSPLLLFGITLLELHAPLTGARVRGDVAGASTRLQMQGCFPGVEVTADVVDHAVVARTLRRGYVTWRACTSGDLGSVDAPGFQLRARVVAREAADDLDDEVFRLGAVH